MSIFVRKTDIESDEYLKIYNYINQLIQSQPELSPNDIYNRLKLDGLLRLNSDQYLIDFEQATILDKTFFGTSGNYWLDAYSRPDEGIIFTKDNCKYRAFNCGIFTCNIDYCGDDCESIKSIETMNLFSNDEKDVPIDDDDYDEYDEYKDEYKDEYVDKNVDSDNKDLILSESKKFANEIKYFVESRLIGEPNIKPWEMFEIIKIHYPEFGIKKKLCFSDAYEIDKSIYGKGGYFWRSAYNLPKESENIKLDIFFAEAKNVGIFTFNY